MQFCPIGTTSSAVPGWYELECQLCPPDVDGQALIHSPAPARSMSSR